jgi:hypothetical protein
MYSRMKPMQPEEIAKYEQLQAAWASTKARVVDAPFKQNWHELVMKRLLDDAARNGYDKVVITPGAEQAKRYDLSKQIGRVVYSPETEMLNAFDLSNRSVIQRGNVKPDQIEEYIGKEPAKRLLDQQNTKIDSRGGKDVPYQEISGLDLQVGGEGMKGFYDQILPSYLNDYGKKYGARVGTYNLPDPEVHHIPTIADIERGGMDMFGRADLTPEETLQVENAFKAQRSAETAIPLHSFDITPQMREEITTKGQPLYQAAPPVAIGAGAAMQEEEPTEYGKGGAVKNVAKILMPRAEQEANFAKFLAESKAPMRLYHGTTATEGGKGEEAIRRFKPSKEGALGSGVYLTPNTNYAEQYTFKGTGNYEGGNTLPVHAQIKNPLILDGSASRDPMIEALMRLGMGEPQASRMVERAYENKGYIGKEVESRARAQGYDGLMQYDRDGELGEVVSYNPSAIKSAIGNEGTYDITNPDMNKAGGGAVKKALKAVLPKGQQAILPAAESAANLERFLAESAIKDRMYHGTFRGGFSTFDRNKTTEWRQPSMDTVGSWFSNNPSEAGGAGMYASGQDASIYPVHLSIKNPKMYNTFNDFLVDMHSAAGRELPKSAPGLGSTEELRQKLKAEGYDGIAFKQTANQSLMQDIQEMQDAVKRARMEELSMKRQEREPYTMKRERLEQTLNSMNKELSQYGSSTEFDEQRVFIPLEPTQIKSAIGNRGTYDPAEADINKAKGGQVTNDAMWIALQNKQLRKKHGN